MTWKKEINWHCHCVPFPSLLPLLSLKVTPPSAPSPVLPIPLSLQSPCYSYWDLIPLFFCFFSVCVCVWAATFSPVSSAVRGLRTSIKKLCAALFLVCVCACERGVGGSSKPAERRDEHKIKKKNETTHCSATSPAYISTLKRVLFHSYFHLSWCAMVCLCTGFISLHSIPILITLFFTPPCFVSEWRDGGE